MSFYPASIPRCQHIKVNGIQCGSPALHRRRFCFFHHQWRQERIAMGAKRARQGRPFDLPVLEDANAIQITLMQIMRLILRGQIDPKSAGLLLYALQTASVNLRNTEFEPRSKTHIVLDPRDIPGTPLGEQQWYPEDFEDEEEEAEDEDQDETEDEDEQEEDDDVEIKAEAAKPKTDNPPKENKQPDGNTKVLAANDPRPAANNRQRSPASPALSERNNVAAPVGPQPKKPPAAISAASPQASAANGQPPSSACPERSGGTNRQTPARWFAPDGTPVTGAKLNELRLLTHFIDCIAPLPPGEKE